MWEIQWHSYWVVFCCKHISHARKTHMHSLKAPAHTSTNIFFIEFQRSTKCIYLLNQYFKWHFVHRAKKAPHWWNACSRPISISCNPTSFRSYVNCALSARKCVRFCVRTFVLTYAYVRTDILNFWHMRLFAVHVDFMQCDIISLIRQLRIDRP